MPTSHQQAEARWANDDRRFDGRTPYARAAIVVQEAPYRNEITRIIQLLVSRFFGSRWCIALLDIGGSMGTVPQQESVII